jgi:hypothetical protein
MERGPKWNVRCCVQLLISLKGMMNKNFMVSQEKGDVKFTSKKARRGVP